MRFTIRAGRLWPSTWQRIKGFLAGYYGIGWSREMTYRMVFPRPVELPQGSRGVGGKLFGRGRGLPRRGFHPVHFSSDRFAFSAWPTGINVSTYAYRRGVKPWGFDAKTWPERSRYLATLEYDRPYFLSLRFRRDGTPLERVDAISPFASSLLTARLISARSISPDLPIVLALAGPAEPTNARTRHSAKESPCFCKSRADCRSIIRASSSSR